MSLSLYDLSCDGPVREVHSSSFWRRCPSSRDERLRSCTRSSRSQGETRRFAPEFSRFLQEEQLDGAIKLAEKAEKSHVARVVGERSPR